MLVIDVVSDTGVVVWSYAGDHTGAWVTQVQCKPQTCVPLTVGSHCGITTAVTVRSD